MDLDKVDKPAQPLITHGDWNSLPPEVHELILTRLPLNEIFKARLVCTSIRDATKLATFHQVRAGLRPWECCPSPVVSGVDKDAGWHLRGFDWKDQIWRKLPPFKSLPIPAPDPVDLFGNICFAGNFGLVCLNVGECYQGKKLYVCNPLTGETLKLPALELQGRPSAIHLHMTSLKRKDITASSFWIVAIGRELNTKDNFLRKTHVYDSVTRKWEDAGDVPGSRLSLSHNQNGVYCESLKLLLFMGILTLNHGKRHTVVAFDVEARKWREDMWICPFYPDLNIVAVSSTSIVQLVGCSGKIYLFSEVIGPWRFDTQNNSQITRSIDRLDLDIRGGHKWTRLLSLPRPMWQDYAHLEHTELMYHEYACMEVGENKLCVFNRIRKTGVVYDMLQVHVSPVEILPALPRENGLRFHGLVPMGYAFKPSFGVSAK